MVIMAAGDVTEGRHVGETAKIGGNRSQPLRDIFLDDELVLGESFEGFHSLS
jgi:hypothetical protein